jgi:hypothetical protein
LGLSALARACSTRRWRRPTAGLTAISQSRPPQADEYEALDLYHATSGGEAALARKRRDEAIRAGTHATAQRAPAISAAE